MTQRNDQQFPSPPPVGGRLSDEAARAIADWPLLAMLARDQPGMAMPPAEADIAVEETAPVFIPPAPQPAAPVMEETAQVAEPELEPALAPLVERADEAEREYVQAPAAVAMREPEPAVRAPSALEQLFNRADKTGQAQPVKRTMFKQSGPPPLKTPSPSAADRTAGQGGAVTIEPRPREWRELETVPERLFDRVGGH